MSSDIVAHVRGLAVVACVALGLALAGLAAAEGEPGLAQLRCVLPVAATTAWARR